MVLVKDVVKALDAWAPVQLKESWDNVGLQMGNPDQKVERVLLALSPTRQVVEEALNCEADLLVTHHPLIFKGPQTLRQDTALGKMIYAMARGDLAHLCAHTNLDIAQGGVNDVLAKRLGVVETRPLVKTQEASFFKLAVFVPVDHFSKVQEALFAAGAGLQGAYDQCSWSVQGNGTFRPQAAANPFSGTRGERAQEEEVRLEVLVGAEVLPKVQAALLEAHPYEEVAYDLFQEEHMKEAVGIGRIGELAEAMSLEACLVTWKQALGLSRLSYHGDLQRKIQRVALCGGSAAGYLEKAAKAGADVYVTGDVRYHDGQHADEVGIALVDAGHYGTEKPVMEACAAYLKGEFSAVEFYQSKVETDLLSDF